MLNYVESLFFLSLENPNQVIQNLLLKKFFLDLLPPQGDGTIPDLNKNEFMHFLCFSQIFFYIT